MKKYIPFILYMLGVYACNTGLPAVSYNPGALPPNYFTIDNRKDTLLKTAGGVSIFIPAGAIKTATANAFRLEVREARSISDMVLAGLITRSHDQPLSSGGMLQIMPAEDPTATITKPLTIKMPTDRVVPGMLLYKGVTGKDSVVNWTEPQTMTVLPPAEKVAAGEQIFKINCASCHDVRKRLTGPPLLHVTAKHSRQWLEEFIINNAKVIASGDCYANSLYEEYYRIAMTTFPTLKGKQMDELLAWLESESKRIDPAGYEQTAKKRDSCESYLLATNELIRKAKSSVMDQLVKADTNNRIYAFMTTTFGWYNVDVPLEDVRGSVNSHLSVSVTGPVSPSTQVFLVIPGPRVFLPGGLLEGKKEEYGFFRKDGYIRLPQQKEAYVIAVDNNKERFSFGITKFQTSPQQTLFVALTPASRARYEEEVEQLAGDIRASAAPGATWQMSAPASARWPKPSGYKCGCDTTSLPVVRQ